MRSGVANTRRVIPEGTHTVRVLSAEHQRVQWRRSHHNPLGEVLALRLAAGQEYAIVNLDIPRDKPGLRWMVAKGFGITPDQLDAEHLVGKPVVIDVEHVHTRRGQIKPVAMRWHPAQQQQQPAR